MIEKPLNVNLELALKNNITVKGITECREYTSTAINILANKEVNFSEFTYNNFSEESLPEKMRESAELFSANGTFPEEMDIFKFMF